jgi:hypothetical protein
MMFWCRCRLGDGMNSRSFNCSLDEPKAKSRKTNVWEDLSDLPIAAILHQSIKIGSDNDFISMQNYKSFFVLGFAALSANLRLDLVFLSSDFWLLASDTGFAKRCSTQPTSILWRRPATTRNKNFKMENGTIKLH